MSPYYPDRQEFLRRARRGNMTPVYKEILADMETPVSAFKKIGKGDYSFLLESVEGGERMARFSFLGSGASLVLKSKGNIVEIHRSPVGDVTTAGGESVADHECQSESDASSSTMALEPGRDVLHVLKEELDKLSYVPDPDLPRFCGGAVGFIGYDMVRFFERLPSRHRFRMTP